MVWSLHFLSVDKSEEGPSPPQAARRRARAPWPCAPAACPCVRGAALHSWTEDYVSADAA
jgi:hypothetical protein